MSQNFAGLDDDLANRRPYDEIIAARRPDQQSKSHNALEQHHSLGLDGEEPNLGQGRRSEQSDSEKIELESVSLSVSNQNEEHKEGSDSERNIVQLRDADSSNHSQSQMGS